MIGWYIVQNAHSEKLFSPSLFFIWMQKYDIPLSDKMLSLDFKEKGDVRLIQAQHSYHHKLQ